MPCPVVSPRVLGFTDIPLMDSTVLRLHLPVARSRISATIGLRRAPHPARCWPVSAFTRWQSGCGGRICRRHLPPERWNGRCSGLAVASFGLMAFAQALFPLWAHHPRHRRSAGAPGQWLLSRRDARPTGRRPARNEFQLIPPRRHPPFIRTRQIVPGRAAHIREAAAGRAVPLDATLAVNPFMGQTGKDLSKASARLAQLRTGKIRRFHSVASERFRRRSRPGQSRALR
ncbi:MAG: putative protein conserved in bacteria (DUF2309) [Rhodobacteraceae bacterium HLUCCA12]|nr:MAG: putative protein conserved in bacteria (DUF2309) [Rhodobacteraceae bacterium HLUCCA12]